MGAPVPKVLMELQGESVLQRSLRALTEGAIFNRILVTFPLAFEAHFRALPLPDHVQLVPGGATRQESVRKGLQALHELGARDEDLVAVHDAARCLLSPALVRRLLEAAAQHHAVTAALPVVDSLTRAEGERSVATVDRQGLWIVQTPQVFRFRLLQAAHRAGQDSEATDDASLVRALHPVMLVPGERRNFKLTTPEDYELAQLLTSRVGAAAQSTTS